MTPFIAEIIGTALLLLLGDGVVANVVLKGTKGENSGWVVITIGWGISVFVAVFVVAAYSGAHINPAVTLGLAIAGKFDPDHFTSWAMVPWYLLAQFIGGALGAFLVWLHYRDHFNTTEDADAKPVDPTIDIELAPGRKLCCMICPVGGENERHLHHPRAGINGHEAVIVASFANQIIVQRWSIFFINYSSQPFQVLHFVLCMGRKKGVTVI